MTNNVKISDEIWNILDERPCIRMNMSNGLINTRALAKYILKEKKLDTTIDAVISAIRRYELGTYAKIFENAHKIINKTTTMSTKSPLANISLVKDTEIQKLLPQLFSIIHYNRGEVLRIIQADGSIKILVDEKNLEKVKELFPNNKIIRVDIGLAEINIHMHPDAKYVPGVLAATANELAINSINLLEAMSCFPEWLWFVEEKDLLKAYNILHQLWQKKTK